MENLCCTCNVSPCILIYQDLISHTLFFIAPSTLGCNFEKDWCSLQQDSSDVFNWTRKQGFTDSVGTGPSGDHTFGRGMHFFFFIVSHDIV